MITSHKAATLKSDKNKASVSQRRRKTLLQDNRNSVHQLKVQSNDKLESSKINSGENLSVATQSPIQRKNNTGLNDSPPNTGDIIQCVSFWKTAATAASTIGSGALLAGGLMSSAALAPLAIAAGGIGLAGSLGYAGYKGYHEYQRHKTLSNVKTELDQYGPTQPNMAHVNKTAGRSQAVMVAPLGLGGHGPSGPLATRNYRVEINTNNPTGEGATDADMISSAITHERTHIANDQSYNANVLRTTNRAPVNLTNTEAADTSRGNREDVIYDNVTELKRTLATDKQIPNQWRTYIKNRLDYITAGMNPSLEYDTVVNELLHFMQLKGIEADSKTAQEITRMAKENHARR